MTEIRLGGEGATRQMDIYIGPLQVYNFQGSLTSGHTHAGSPEETRELVGFFY